MNTEELLREIAQLKLEKENAINLAQRKNLFLSSISHEIRTPISAIVSLTGILLEENPNEKQIEILQTMKFSADNLLKLLNDILQYTKIDSGRIELEEIEISLPELIKNIKQTFSESFKNKNLEFIVELDKKVPTIIIGDPLRISQLLTNLISNSIKFTISGYIKLSVKLKNHKANFVEIEFSVVDTGIGIGKDKLNEIFDFFTQGDISISRRFGGTGLGLAITKKILDMMESKIVVESELEKGSKFSFSLYLRTPLLSNQKEDKQIVQPQEKKSLNGLKLLLVEDNISNQKVALRYLQKWEIDSDVAGNGVICLEKVNENEYDVILMDLQMPEMDGFIATKEIRKLLNTKKNQIPIIALTATALMDTQSKVTEAGMNDYLTKPFVPNELYNTIAKYFPNK